MNATKPVFYKPIFHEFPVRVEAPAEVVKQVVEKKKEVYQGMKPSETKLVGVSNLREGSIVSGKK